MIVTMSIPRNRLKQYGNILNPANSKDDKDELPLFVWAM